MALRRGFKDAHVMNDHMVNQWNSVVTKRDIVWILGDITMEKATDYWILDTLNGTKKVVLGNHDKPNHSVQLLNYVNSVAGMVKFKGVKDCPVWLTHCPIHPNELEYRVKFNVHGHVHEQPIDDPRYINVSAEMVDYTPQILTELIQERNGR